MSKAVFIARNVGIVVWALALGVLALLKGEMVVAMFLVYLLFMPVIVTVQLIASFQSRVGIAKESLTKVAGLQIVLLLLAYTLMPTSLAANVPAVLFAASLGIIGILLLWPLIHMVVRYKRSTAGNASSRKIVKSKVTKSIQSE